MGMLGIRPMAFRPTSRLGGWRMRSALTRRPELDVDDGFVVYASEW
jgi:hypothetical protein